MLQITTFEMRKMEADLIEVFAIINVMDGQLNSSACGGDCMQVYSVGLPVLI